MFVDRVKIKVKAGNGGDGIVSFHREKYVDHGGPDGGDGGRGGSVIFKASKDDNTLIDFYYKKKWWAEDAKNGEKRNCTGADGKDLIITVPVGTQLYSEGKLVYDFFEDGEEKIILKGGKGGKGNNFFKSSTRQAPAFSETGDKTKEYEFTLELKTIADIGLIGYPNVGKSTFLSVVSNAKPKIANYHFTTLSPNLGVVQVFDKSFVIADIPGLIEGASQGAGLGYDFLRHIERTRMLIHIIDGAGFDGRNPVEDYCKINYELSEYSKKLTKLKQIVVLNKMDSVTEPEKVLKDFKTAVKGVKVFLVSAITKQGVDEVLKECVKILEKLPKQEREPEDFVVLEKNDNSFEIIKTGSLFEVTGDYIDNLIKGVVVSNSESFAYFQKRLRQDGVIASLFEKGLKAGDEVKVKDIVFEWLE